MNYPKHLVIAKFPNLTSASGPKQTFHFALRMSALGSKADMVWCSANVR
jgi:hypothetical protein